MGWRILLFSFFACCSSIASAKNWEVKTATGSSYSPARFAISLEDHSAAFSSSAYCVDTRPGSSDEPISYVRALCDECASCAWKKREGFTTETEWQAAVTSEMSRLEGGGMVGTWLAEAPFFLTVDDKLVTELGSKLDVYLDLHAVADSGDGDRGYYIVSGTTTCIPGMLSAGFSSLTPIPPRLKIDPVLEESAAAANLALKVAARSNGVDTATSDQEDQTKYSQGFHNLYVQLSKKSSRGPSYTNATATESEHRPAQLLSTAWSGMMFTRAGHDNARVEAEGAAHVSIRGLASRAEVYMVALEIAHHGEVTWVSPQGRLTSSNYFGSQLVQSGAWSIPEAWGAEIPETFAPLTALGLTGKGQVLGVVDTGLDWESCFFKDKKVTPKLKWNQSKRNKNREKGKYETWQSKKHRKIRQYVAYMNGEEDEADGHGTHVCGSAVGGRPEQDLINRDYQGVAPDAKIAFFDTYAKTEDPPLRVPVDMGGEVLKKAYFNAGARVYLASFNDENRLRSAYSPMASSIDEFLWLNPELVVLVSAGNLAVEGRSEGAISIPGESKNAITVGSHFNPNKEFGAPPKDISKLLTVAGNSAEGPTMDGRIKPDICGPGNSVYSAASTPPGSTGPDSENCRGVVKSGTSSANAIVAGATLLVRQYFTEGYYPDGVKSRLNKFVPTGALLKAILINSARRLNNKANYNNDGADDQQFPNFQQGWGGVNLASTLVTPNSPTGLALKVYGKIYGGLDDCWRGCPRIRPGKTTEYKIKVTADTHNLPLKVTLVWYDHPVNPSNLKALRGDLDLTVTENGAKKEDNVWYFANGQNEYDRTNTVEHIEISEPKPSTTYTVRVNGGGKNSAGKYENPFSLVISGPFDAKHVKTKTVKNKRKRFEGGGDYGRRGQEWQVTRLDDGGATTNK